MDKKLKYYDLMEDLRKQIVSGKIKPGEKLPSENELSGTYQVSRQTVRKALQILQNEGYIYAEHGRGTFCSEMARRTGAFGIAPIRLCEATMPENAPTLIKPAWPRLSSPRIPTVRFSDTAMDM